MPKKVYFCNKPNHKDMIDLSTTYMGLQLKNPLVAGSSGLTDSLDNIIQLEKSGIAAVVLKSLFEEEIIKDLNARMSRMTGEGFLYPETLEYYEHHDTKKELSEEYLDLISDTKKNVSIPVIASINCMTAKNWTYFPRQIEQAGADGLELNIFILPTDLERSGTENENIYFDIIDEIKKQVKMPVSVKISYYFSNLASMIQRLSVTGIQGIVLFNRFYSPDFDIENMEITSSSVLSSPSDITISLRWIAIMSERVKCDLAASTGVHDGNGLIKQILAGANAVQVASTLYKNGFSRVENMLSELKSWMSNQKYKKIDDFRGYMSQSSVKNPAAYERVQFMKYFRGYQH